VSYQPPDEGRPPPPAGPTPPPPPGGYAWQQQGYGSLAPVRRDHPDAALILGFGIAALASLLFLCGLLLPLAPVAWVKGNRARAEIAASQGTLGGEDSVRAGQVCGIIGTVLLALWAAGWLTLLLLAVSA